jgi:hypothetical protein
MHSPDRPRSVVRVMSIVAMALAVGALSAGCSAPASPAIRTAQRYTQVTNLRQLDLPSGWTSQSSSSGSSSIRPQSLTASQMKTTDTIVSSLPFVCRGLKSLFVASLESAPPAGSVAQNQVQFTSATDGNTVISSTIVVFPTLSDAGSTDALFSAPSFPGCLQGFLQQALVRFFNMTVQTETIVSLPPPTTPVGVLATALSVTQAASRSGSQTNESVTHQAVMQSGRAMAFVDEQSDTTDLPADAQTVFDLAVSIVAHRMSTPPH